MIQWELCVVRIDFCCGTCVVLSAAVCRTLNIEFELKGIEITRTDEETGDMSVIVDENTKEKSDEEERSSGWLRCCFICLYALCFSVIKQIKFWNNETLESIISHAENEFKNLAIKKDCNIFDIANPVIIQGAPVEVSFNEVGEAVIEEEICAVCNQMKTSIMQKQDKNTGMYTKLSICCLHV